MQIVLGSRACINFLILCSILYLRKSEGCARLIFYVASDKFVCATATDGKEMVVYGVDLIPKIGVSVRILKCRDPIK